jgi:predicted nucleic acid-binding protein
VSGIAFDTNILLYAELEAARPKGQLARRLLNVLAGQGIVAAQALGEFVTVTRRRLPRAAALAVRQVDVYRRVFSVPPTDADLVLAAAAFAERYRLQFWDAVIWQASAKGGATILLTEDLQHGFSAGGMRAVNPYALPNWPSLAREIGIRG